jgi:GNAT superfamily N-acetyltransferase
MPGSGAEPRPPEAHTHTSAKRLCRSPAGRAFSAASRSTLWFVGIRIRTAEAADVSLLVTSAIGLFQDDAGVHDPTMNVSWPEAEGEPYYAAAVADPSTLCLVAEENGELVAHLIGRLQAASSLRLVDTAVLESIRVVPDQRGKGVGTALAESFVDWARSRGATRATVTAYAANERAVRFYQRHGFAARSITLDRTL